LGPACARDRVATVGGASNGGLTELRRCYGLNGGPVSRRACRPVRASSVGGGSRRRGRWRSHGRGRARGTWRSRSCCRAAGGCRWSVGGGAAWRRSVQPPSSGMCAKAFVVLLVAVPGCGKPRVAVLVARSRDWVRPSGVVGPVRWPRERSALTCGPLSAISRYASEDGAEGPTCQLALRTLNRPCTSAWLSLTPC
jgi:hypothetical protein